MCRSIKTLRTGAVPASEEEIRAAALQFVRKISGFRSPAPHNAETFEAAVDEISGASERLLGALKVRGAARYRGLAVTASSARSRGPYASPRPARRSYQNRSP